MSYIERGFLRIASSPIASSRSIFDASWISELRIASLGMPPTLLILAVSLMSAIILFKALLLLLFRSMKMVVKP